MMRDTFLAYFRHSSMCHLLTLARTPPPRGVIFFIFQKQAISGVKIAQNGKLLFKKGQKKSSDTLVDTVSPSVCYLVTLLQIPPRVSLIN